MLIPHTGLASMRVATFSIECSDDGEAWASALADGLQQATVESDTAPNATADLECDAR